MSTKRKQAVLSIKDKQIIISRLERRERNKFSSRIWHQQAAENELPTSLQMSDEENLATVVGDSTESECFKKCLSWMESQNDIDPVQLRRMMDFAMRSSYKSLKQTNMLEHFRPL